MPDRPVTWAEAKEHMRLTDDTQQSYVESLIDAAAQAVEEETASTLMQRERSATFQSDEPIVLTRGPIISIDSVIDDDGTVFAADSYEARTVGHQTWLRITEGSPVYPITVTYQAGYATAAAIPPVLRLAVLQLTALQFEHREGVSDRQKNPVPLSLQQFLRLMSRKAPVG